jgi:hypothetical protein
MAGDWMKIELELPDKPEIHAMAGMLGIDPDAVVGKLIRVWQWFDKHTTDGNAHGVSFALVDRVTSVSGFGESMSFVGWLEQHDKTLVMPRFDRHTSKSAKTRALGAKRVANFNAKPNADTNANTNGASVSDALPREEKRRDKEHTADKPAAFCFKTTLLEAGGMPDLVTDWMKVRSKLKATNTKTAFTMFMGQVSKAGYTVNQALEICCARSWKGFEAEWVKDVKPVTSEEQVKADPAEAQRSKEWAQFEYAVRSFRETVWPDGMEADRLRRAAEIQEIANSFGVTFERPLLEVAA